MRLTSTHRIGAPREKVFAALMDPAVLARCISGCEAMVQSSDGAYEVDLKVGVGAIKGRYKGTVRIEERREPESFTLRMEGRGLPGFVQSTTAIRLAEKEGGTEVTAEAQATVGGLIASVGSRLVEGLARKMSHEFFASLAREVEG